MSFVRRMGVIADYGSLENYRSFLTTARANCARVIEIKERTAATAADIESLEEHRLNLTDWDINLEWVDAELAREAA